LKIGAECLFEQGKKHDDLDATEVGSAVLFSRKAEVSEEDGTTTAAGPAPAALPDGNTIIRKGHALTHANVVKRNYPNLTAKEAAQEINARLAAENLERYSEKHLMRIINKLGFKKGKSGRPPEK
jgi:hypothetical protein